MYTVIKQFKNALWVTYIFIRNHTLISQGRETYNLRGWSHFCSNIRSYFRASNRLFTITLCLNHGNVIRRFPKIKCITKREQYGTERKCYVRALAGICEFHRSYFKRLWLNRSVIPRTSARFDWLFGMSTSPRETASKASESRIGSLSNNDGDGNENGKKTIGLK